MLQRLCIAVMVCLGLGAGSLWGAPSKTSDLPKGLARGAVGLKLGIINTGTVKLTGRYMQRDTIEVEGYELDPRAAVSGEVYFDVPMAPWFSLLFAADVYDIRFETLSERYIDVAAGVKFAL